jgi:hypothetical protein
VQHISPRVIKSVLGAAIGLCAGATAIIAAIPASDPVSRLAGPWTGDAVMTSMSGEPETFKCVVTYLPTGAGSGMKQNLRCKGASINLEAATLLEIDGTKVTGRWEVLLGGQFFQAKMAVAGSECAQQVIVSPQRSSYFRELSADLRKC